jgi:putative redox protein
MEPLFRSEGLELAGHLALPGAPARAGGRMPGVILCHGFPSGAGGAATSAATYPELADRIAGEVGWAALTFNFRGCGQSQGNFSLRGWLADLGAAIDHLAAVDGIDGIWLAGASTGGSLCIARAASDPSIRGVAALAARADFDDWASHPRRFCDHARDIGMIREPGFPAAFDAWARELREIRPLELVRQLPPRPLLVIHGSEDDFVPVADARVLADAHGECDLRIVTGAGHRLRHDPRAIAILLGWLDRQKARLTA